MLPFYLLSALFLRNVLEDYSASLDQGTHHCSVYLPGGWRPEAHHKILGVLGTATQMASSLDLLGMVYIGLEEICIVY